MTTEQHKETFHRLLGTIKEVFSHQDELSPMMYKITEGGVDIFVIASMKDEKEKDAVANLMVKLVDEGAEALAFVAESWTLPPEFNHTYKKYPSIEANPHRVEIVMFNYSTAKGDWIATAPIIRQSENDPWGITFSNEPVKPKLGEWRVEDDIQRLGGRFSHLWNKARALHHAEN